MSKDKYPIYAVGIVVAAGLAVWAGISPFFLILLACPLMMFFMMRGMNGGHENHGGQENHGGSSGHHEAGAPSSTGQPPPDPGQPPSDPGQPWHPDGSHERIDQP